MKKYFIVFLSLLITSAYAQNVKNFYRLENGGTGPYKAIVRGEVSLTEHTIYRPENLSEAAKAGKLPIMVFGNGGCSNSSKNYQNFLNEIASQGYLVIANGPFVPEGDSLNAEDQKKRTTSKMLIESLDWVWATAKNPTSEYYEKLDLTKVAVAGMSCGGLQSIEVAADPRVKTTLVMNSGVLNSMTGNPISGMPNVTKSALKAIHTPTLYVIGDSTDIAYPNAKDDFSKIDHVPVIMANLNVGHSGTYRQPHGGAFTPLVLNWLDWQLKGKNDLATQFLGQQCGWCGFKGWRIEAKNFK